MAVCNLNTDSTVVPNNCSDNPDVEHFRWDHAPLDNYYEQTRIALQPILDKIINFENNLQSYDSNSKRIAIDHLYEEFVYELRSSANIFIPKHTKISSSFGGPKNLMNLNLMQYHPAEHGKQLGSLSRELFLMYTKKTKPFIKNASATSRLEKSFATLTISTKLFFTKMDETSGKFGTQNLNANLLI
jgi:hypothetical protein